MSEIIIQQKIHFIRGKRVMLDFDLAELYGVDTKRLNEQVKRNLKRFPHDFMFQLEIKELMHLRSQFATSSYGGRRRPPYAFTQEGVAMLSSVLHSDNAIAVNITIMRAFVTLRAITEEHTQLKNHIKTLEDIWERKFEKHDTEIKRIFRAITQLMCPPEKPRKKIGFRT